MDTIPTPGLTAWTRELDQACSDLRSGRLVDSDTILAELDADLASMDPETDDLEDEAQGLRI